LDTQESYCLVSILSSFVNTFKTTKYLFIDFWDSFYYWCNWCLDSLLGLRSSHCCHFSEFAVGRSIWFAFFEMSNEWSCSYWWRNMRQNKKAIECQVYWTSLRDDRDTFFKHLYIKLWNQLMIYVILNGNGSIYAHIQRKRAIGC
jgi:hypothetical protein